MNTRYRQLILDQTKKYRDKLDKIDFAHDSDHLFRVESLAKEISIGENADIEIIEASSLIFDVARDLEDKGKVTDHAIEGANIARKILTKINFPKDKIDGVCHAISVHRRSSTKTPESIEAKILRDADYLDATGAIAVIRSITSSVQSKKYKRPIYVDKPFEEGDAGLSGIHFVMFMLKHNKHQPKNFYTKMGRKIAKSRFQYMKNFVEEFIAEWHGEK